LRKPVDWAVLEIGVGGRQDPVRALPHATTVFARIGFDHEALLGSSLAAITREKLGAIDSGSLVVHAPFPVEAREVVAEVRATLGGRWIEAPVFPSRVVDDATGGIPFEPCGKNSRGNELLATTWEPRWVIESPWGQARLSLLGSRAVFNASLALTTAAELGLPVRELVPALSRVEWPCRMERFEISGQAVYLSGDHNPQGVESLLELLSHFRYRKVHLLIGVGKNKNMPAMLEAFERIPRAEIHLTTTPFRSSTVEDLRLYRDRVASVEVDPVVALKNLVKEVDVAESVDESAESEGVSSGVAELIIVTGSLYLAGYLRGEILQGRLGEWTKAMT
jgi:dihydrofolate synthase/folylpolyglutamate synthase